MELRLFLILLCLAVLSSCTKEEHEKEPQMSGERLFRVSCASCHTSQRRLVGPPIEEIQEKYKNRPKPLIEYAKNPTKIRNGYPPMPAQSYLNDAQLEAIAVYILKSEK